MNKPKPAPQLSPGKDNRTSGDTPLGVLFYEAPSTKPWRIAVPLALTCLQIFWIPVLLFPPLGWDRPKNLGWDSLYFLLMAAPSLVAMIASTRAARHVPSARRVVMIVCACFSLALAAWVAYMWVLNLLLDRNGRWYPL